MVPRRSQNTEPNDQDCRTMDWAMATGGSLDEGGGVVQPAHEESKVASPHETSRVVRNAIWVTCPELVVGFIPGASGIDDAALENGLADLAVVIEFPEKFIPLNIDDSVHPCVER